MSTYPQDDQRRVQAAKEAQEISNLTRGHIYATNTEGYKNIDVSRRGDLHLGNPFLLPTKNPEADRDKVCDAHLQYMKYVLSDEFDEFSKDKPNFNPHDYAKNIIDYANKHGLLYASTVRGININTVNKMREAVKGIAKEVEAGKKIRLTCYCKNNQRCHADNYVQFIKDMIRGDAKLAEVIVSTEETSQKQEKSKVNSSSYTIVRRSPIKRGNDR